MIEIFPFISSKMFGIIDLFCLASLGYGLFMMFPLVFQVCDDAFTDEPALIPDEYYDLFFQGLKIGSIGVFYFTIQFFFL